MTSEYNDLFTLKGAFHKQGLVTFTVTKTPPPLNITLGAYIITKYCQTFSISDVTCGCDQSLTPKRSLS